MFCFLYCRFYSLELYITKYIYIYIDYMHIVWDIEKILGRHKTNTLYRIKKRKEERFFFFKKITQITPKLYHSIGHTAYKLFQEAF